jgi:hypothetical protein
MRRLSWVSVLATALLVDRAPAEDTAADAAIAAALARRTSSRTVEIELKVAEVIAKGAKPIIAQAPRLPEVLRPDKAVSASWINRVVLDGEKFRYEDNTPAPPTLDGKRPTQSAVYVFNGSDNILFQPRSPANDGHPLAIVIQGAGASTWSVPELPIQSTFRGAATSDNRSVFAELRPTGQALSMDGTPYPEFEVRPGKESSRAARPATHYWLDAAKGFVVRRTRTVRRGGIVEQLDIHYRQHAVCGPVPASWVTTVSAADGRPLITTNVAVVKLRLNAPQPAALFDEHFPAGTLVVFRSRDGTQQPRSFRVEDDGAMREVSLSGEALAPSEGPSEQAPLPGGGWATLGWLAGGLAVLLLLAHYAQRLRRARVR